MTPKAECESIAAEIGATLHVAGGRYFECNAEAPAGFVWKATWTHEVVSCSDPPGILPAHCWRALLADMRLGVTPCTNPDCDWCEKDAALAAAQPQE